MKYPTVDQVLSRKAPTDKELTDAIKMMRDMGLVPTGKGPATKPKPHPDFYIVWDSKEKIYYLVTQEGKDLGRWWIVYPQGGSKPLGEFKGQWSLLSGQKIYDEGEWRDYVPLEVIQEVYSLIDPTWNDYPAVESVLAHKTYTAKEVLNHHETYSPYVEVQEHVREIILNYPVWVERSLPIKDLYPRDSLGDLVEKYAELYRKGQRFPAIIAVPIDDEPPYKWEALDGANRTAAAREVGLTRMKAFVPEGS